MYVVILSVLIDHCSALEWGYRLAVSDVPIRLNVDTGWLYLMYLSD